MLDLQIAKQRIKQIFEYLKALNEHRNPSVRQVGHQPWFLWLDDLPGHPSIEFPQRVALTPESEADNNDGEPAYLLRVRRPKLTKSPPPPDELQDWLLAGWDDPFKDPEVSDSKNILDTSGETLTIRFADDPNRVTALAGWLQKREAWKDAELPARAAMDVFDKLYALHGTMEREGEKYDLVVGDGILSWQQQEGSIYHPLLLQRVQLTFDPKKPEFRIVDADVGSELYTGLFQSVSDSDPRVLRAQREEYEAGGYHPFDQECSGVLEGFVNQLSAQGTFISHKRPPMSAESPTIGRSAVLFLRSRTKGFGTAIQRVIESIEERTEFCDAFHNIVGLASDSQQPVVLEPTSGPSLELHAKDVLFGKPANPEQLRIARTLDRHGSVLVQGPPGTGKSHTIANLIGHLLANNQSVLVTSHTTKALRVLRDQLVNDLKPLCVSLLESDLDSRQELEQSVHAISSRLSESDAESLEHEARWLENQREALIDRLHALQEELKNARADEYRSIVYGGNEVSPSDAARTVASGRGLHDWIPAPVALGEPCPLAIEEAQELYGTNERTLKEDEECADLQLPEPGELPSPDAVAASFRQWDELADKGQLDRSYWPNARFTAAHIGQLDSIVLDLRSVAAEFVSLDGWKLAAVDAGRNQLPEGSPWNQLLFKIDEGIELARLVQADTIVHGPELVDQSSLQTQLVAANELLQHLAEGGALGWLTLLLRSPWKKALSNWRVKGRKPESAEQITAVQRLIAIHICRVELRDLWDGLLAANGGPQSTELGSEPERSANQFSFVIRNAFEWWLKKWVPVEQRLLDLGFDWPRFIGEQPPDLGRYGEIHRIMSSVRLRLIDHLERTRDQLKSLVLNRQMGEVLGRLRSFDRPEVVALRSSLENKDYEAYVKSYQTCLAAAERRMHALRRRELLAKLMRPSAKGSAIAEGWAEAIRQRQDAHGKRDLPGDILKAWDWRQINDELDRRSKVDLEDLGRQIQDVSDQLKLITNQLIDRKAWSGQVRRTGTSQRQALMGWLSIVKRIGKGFGRRVPQLRYEAQQKMKECRDAVPVWVMPLSRLVENFDFSEPRFDVVIIDEASQCDVMALMALAIARKVVVVGDDKQVSPSAVGQKIDIIHNLIKLHLNGIPNAILYDGTMSIYDLAKQAFSGVICLLEHFRCVPDIIQFSNHLCYAGDIKPLREQGSSPFRRSMVPYRVEGGMREDGIVNPVEAVTIASLIVAASKLPAYAGQTFGVISLVGDEQAMEIDRLLRQRLSPDEYERRRIVCGNPAQFQGDERHVMFLSMVDSPGDGPLRMSDRDETKQRYNVAASRAQNQAWVVYSLNHEVDLQPRDLRRRLIEHAIDPKAITREVEQGLSRTESPFEQDVYERLTRHGYCVRPQWQVGRYRIDLVVEGKEGRVAIECDGDRYHPIEKLPEDMERQAILERLGWRFVRIRGSVFFRDRDSTMENVFTKLTELKVFPTARELLPDVTASSQQDPVDEVIRRAAELRSQWATTRSRGEKNVDRNVPDGTEASAANRNEHSDSRSNTVRQANAPSELEPSDVVPRSHSDEPRFSAEEKETPSEKNVQREVEAVPIEPASNKEFKVIPGSAKRRHLFDSIEDSEHIEASVLHRQIVQLVSQQSGLKDREIANALGIDKALVNSILSQGLHSQLRKDENARWWPK